MTNTKHTKKALFSSVIALILCFSMLLGTTFAWFTDEVVSAGNKIVSGTLKIDLEVKKSTVEGKTDYDYSYEYVSVKEDKAAIFDYDLWEPGYVEVRNVKVENEGTLALKYTMDLVVTADSGATANAFDLADVIDVYYAASEVEVKDRNLDGLTRLGTLSEILENANGTLTVNDNMLKGETDYATLALKMQESAGNDYQNLSVGANFDIRIYATQYTYESDSFDDKYDDGLTPVGEGDVLTEVDGLQYLQTADGEKLLYLVPQEYAEDTVVVPEGITAIGGYAFYYNNNVKNIVLPSTVTTLNSYAFRGTSATSITLNEGLETIGYQAFRDATELTTIEIPSTVTTIGEQAFRLSGVTEIIVPESVTSIETGAFRDMPGLTTITIEGNPVIANFAGRTCPALTTVYLKGDNVTFSGTSQAFSHADSGDANGITIYVENATVAARVYVAQGSAYGYEVKISSDSGNDEDATDVPYVKNDGALSDAVNNGATEIVLSTGNYTIPSAVASKDITIIGSGDKTVFNFEKVYNISDASITFENLKIQGPNANTMSGFGIQGTTGDILYKNCTFDGAVTNENYANSVTYDNCTFTGTGYITTYACKAATFVDCTFDKADSRAVLVYSHGDNPVVVKLTGCTFKAAKPEKTGQGDWTAAIEVDTTNIKTAGTTVTVENCTYDANYSGLVRDKSAAGSTPAVITIDGITK